MASVSDVVGELEAIKGQLEAAKGTVDSAIGKTEEMIGQATAMELTATVEGLQALHAQITEYGEQVAGLSGGVDPLIEATEALRDSSS